MIKKIFLISIIILGFFVFKVEDINAGLYGPDLLDGRVVGIANILDATTLALRGYVVFNKNGPNSCDTDYNNAIDVNCKGDNNPANYPISVDYGLKITRPSIYNGYTSSGRVWYYMNTGEKGWLDINRNASTVDCNNACITYTPSPFACKFYTCVNNSYIFPIVGWAQAFDDLSGWIYSYCDVNLPPLLPSYPSSQRCLAGLDMVTDDYYATTFFLRGKELWYLGANLTTPVYYLSYDTGTVKLEFDAYPIVDLKVTYNSITSDGPISINSGDTINLTWTSTRADSCTTSGDWSDTISTSGSVTKSNLTSPSPKIYIITCTGSGGRTDADSVVVNINANTKPIVVPQNPEPDFCPKSALLADQGKVTLKWTYTDTEGDRQYSYMIHLTSTGIDKSCKGTMDVPSGGDGSALIITMPVADSNCSISDNGQTYNWTLSVKAQTGDTDWTTPVAGNSFTAPSQPWPYVRFTPPDRPRTSALLTFTDNSMCYYSGSMISCTANNSVKDTVSYLWEFNEGDSMPCSGATCSVSTDKGDGNHKYNASAEGDQFLAVLTITQTQGGTYVCPYSLPIWVGDSLKPPKWIEITPF